jgi:catechol 2,3-dioxygenase-like lactoylglutathione lyase family enzyme
MEILGFDHIQLAMPSGGEAAARAFYAHVLGLSEVEKPLDLAARGGCWFERGVVKIHLGTDQDFRPARKAHPGLLVRGLEILVARLEAKGFSIARGEPIEGYDRVHVNDPFGNRIELMEVRPIAADRGTI